MDRLSSMTIFVRVVESGSFSKAADALSMSSQAVGKHIRSLEDYLGVKLLHRTTRRQSTTDFGREYYERIRHVLAEITTAESLAAESRTVPRGRLRINAPVTFGAHELAPALPAYLADFSEVDIELTLSDRLVDLVDEGYDVVFRTGALSDSSLRSRTLRPMPFMLCASPDYISARGEPQTPDDLRHHECLGFAYGYTRGRWSFSGPEGETEVEVACRLVANNGQALLTLTLAGLGILLQPPALVRDAIEDGRLVRLLPNYRAPSRPMHLLYAPDRRITPKLRTFIDFAVSRFGP